MNSLKISKLISVLMVMLFICTNFVCINTNAISTSTNRQYRQFNAQTGSIYRSSYTISARPTRVYSTYSNVADDNLIRNTTESTTVLLKFKDGNGFHNLGTAFIVDEHTLMTCAHCLYNSTQKKAVSAIYAFVYYNNDTRCSVYPAIYSHVPIQYINGDSNYDYGILTFSDSFEGFGAYELGVMTDVSNANISVNVTGFPDDGNYSGLGLRYTSPCTVTSTSDYMIHFSGKVYGGQSGSPLYTTTTYKNTKYNIVTGITKTTGSATRITPDILAFVYQNSYLNLK